MNSEDNGIDDINLNDFAILLALLDPDDKSIGRSKIKGVTKSEVSIKSKFSIAKVGQVFKNFILLGYIEEGLRKGRAKTFFITNKGLEKISEFKEEIII